MFPQPLNGNGDLCQKKLLEYRKIKLKEYLVAHDLDNQETIRAIIGELEEERDSYKQKILGTLVLAGGMIVMIWDDIRKLYLKGRSTSISAELNPYARTMLFTSSKFASCPPDSIRECTRW